jgi:hypothetical protein
MQYFLSGWVEFYSGGLSYLIVTTTLLKYPGGCKQIIIKEIIEDIDAKQKKIFGKHWYHSR